MSYQPKHPAAFINALSEHPKADVLEWLQRTWDELQDAKQLLRESAEIIEEERDVVQPTAKGQIDMFSEEAA